MARSLKILTLSAEMTPFVKVGGPADVVGALPKALRSMGHDIRIALPAYRSVRPDQFGITPCLDTLTVPFKQGTEIVSVSETSIANSPVYFINAPKYFHRDNIFGYNDDGARFILFCRAALEFCKAIGWSPDIIHAHEWHTAIVPNWMHTLYHNDPFFANTATVFTIHNLAYQGIFGLRILEIAGIADQEFLFPAQNDMGDVVDLMARGIMYSDVVTTVSETYAKEIITPEFGEKLDHLLRQRSTRLYGVLNGIDAESLNPATDPYITQNYDIYNLEQRAENKRALQEISHLHTLPDAPLIGFVSRLTNQKGCDLFTGIIDNIIKLGAQLLIVGSGDSYYHEIFSKFTEKYPGRVSTHFTFGADWTQPLYAGADMYLMPSRFEPCGLNQMIAMRYGAIPIVRATGGLADTVAEFSPENNTGEGFVFEDYNNWDLYGAIARAVQSYRFKDSWRQLMIRAMSRDYSWTASAARYTDLYERALEFHREDAALSAPSDISAAIDTHDPLE